MAISKKVSLGGLDGYSLKDGGSGPAALLEKDGNYDLTVVKCEAKQNEKDNWVAMTLSVNDSDAKGSVLYKNIFTDGEFENGNRKGQKRVSVLLDALLSAGKSDFVNSQIKAGDLDLDEAAKVLTNSRLYARVAQSEGQDGKMRSEPIYFIKPEFYRETQQSGTNFRVPPQAKATGKKTPGAPASATNTSTGAGQTVTDQMASDV